LFYSFPDLEEDIRLYSCLAHGSADEFNRGEILFKNKVRPTPSTSGIFTVIPVPMGLQRDVVYLGG
jgi:hypothetical protein